MAVEPKEPGKELLFILFPILFEGMYKRRQWICAFKTIGYNKLYPVRVFQGQVNGDQGLSAGPYYRDLFQLEFMEHGMAYLGIIKPKVGVEPVQPIRLAVSGKVGKNNPECFGVLS